MENKTISAEEKRLAYNAYHRRYKAENPDKILRINIRRYAKKAKELEAAEAAASEASG